MLARSRFTIVATTAFAAAFLLWSLFTPGWVDQAWRWATPEPRSAVGQVASAFALITSPLVVYALLLIAAWWCSRRGFHAMCGATLLTVALSWPAAIIAAELLARPRPGSPWDHLITQTGLGYPSAHTTAAAAAAITMATLTTTARRSRTTLLAWRAAGASAVMLVGLDQLLLGAHRPTDVAGGVLLGGLTASLANLLCDVHVLHTPRPSSGSGRAAVIYNPAKVRDHTILADLMDRELEERGWQRPIWLATTPDDPGTGMAGTALAAEVDLVLVAGGDGTVRAVCEALSGSDVPVALLPSGTGNLLARNLGIPLDTARAVELAFSGAPAPIDLLRWRDLESHAEGTAAVMVGLGADAKVIQDTDENLKKQIGPVAYLVAGMSHIRATPTPLRIMVDDGEAIERNASLVEIGNVGQLQAGVSLLPGASARDGLLDVLVASPRHAGDIAQMMAGVLTQATEEPLIDRFTGQSVEVEAARSLLCQVDGDLIGEMRRIRFEVLERAVTVVLPPP